MTSKLLAEYNISLVSKIPSLGSLVKKRIGENFVAGLSLGKKINFSLSIPKITDYDAIQKSIANANIVLGDPSLIEPHLRNINFDTSNLEWVQSTWAGVEGMVQLLRDLSSHSHQTESSVRLEDGESLNKKAKVDQITYPFMATRISGIFGSHMAEYCIGHIIGRERQFERLAFDQQQRLWLEKEYSYRRMNELKIGILGIGSIGLDIAKVLKTGFSVSLVRGVARTKKGTPFIDEWYTLSELNIFLSGLDYIINTLPTTANTKGLLSGEVLKHCHHPNNGNSTAVLINVGRGAIIDSKSILHALKEKWISHAILDVFNEEPLPQSSPLWDAKNVTITPHVSAMSQADEIADCFQQNLVRFLKKEILLYQVDASRGY